MNHRRILTTLAGILLVSLLTAPQALAKAYTIDQVRVAATLATDGSMKVTEKRTVTFSGDFSRLFWVLDKGGGSGIEFGSVKDDMGTSYVQTTDGAGVDDRTQRIPGTVYVVDTGDALEIHAYHDAANSTRTFTLAYRVRGAVVRYSDCAELYWKLVGDGWEVGTADFSAEIMPPDRLDGAAEVNAWGHGPLAGQVDVLPDGVVTLAVADLPPRTFVEARVLYPESVFASAPSVNEAKRGTVLAAEGELAESANARRSAALGAGSLASADSGPQPSWRGPALGLAELAVIMAAFAGLSTLGRSRRHELPSFGGIRKLGVFVAGMLVLTGFLGLLLSDDGQGMGFASGLFLFGVLLAVTSAGRATKYADDSWLGWGVGFLSSVVFAGVYAFWMIARLFFVFVPGAGTPRRAVTKWAETQVTGSARTKRRYDAAGNYAGVTLEDGKRYDESGHHTGVTLEGGKHYDAAGNYTGVTFEDGRHYDASGNYTGVTLEDGRHFDESGNYTGVTLEE